MGAASHWACWGGTQRCRASGWYCWDTVGIHLENVVRAHTPRAPERCAVALKWRRRRAGPNHGRISDEFMNTDEPRASDTHRGNIVWLFTIEFIFRQVIAPSQTRLGDRETFMLNQLAQKIQTKFLVLSLIFDLWSLVFYLYKRINCRAWSARTSLSPWREDSTPMVRIGILARVHGSKIKAHIRRPSVPRGRGIARQLDWRLKNIISWCLRSIVSVVYSPDKVFSWMRNVASAHHTWNLQCLETLENVVRPHH